MVDLEHLADLFEAEKIDIEILRDMTHEDLKSIGVSTFGWRHKILEKFASEKSLPQHMFGGSKQIQVRQPQEQFSPYVITFKLSQPNTTQFI